MQEQLNVGLGMSALDVDLFGRLRALLELTYGFDV